MQKHLLEIKEYFEYKILAGLFASLYSDELIMLLIIFVALEFLDIFSRWLYQSKKCYCAMYSNFPAGLSTYIKFLPQARKWRYINSWGMRKGCDKIIVYLILLLLSALADGAFMLVHLPQRMLLTTVTMVLTITETMSILENLALCDVAVIAEIKDKFKKRVEK